MPKRMTNDQIRRKVLEEVRAEVRADILLDYPMIGRALIDPVRILERITKTIDDLAK